MKELEKKKTEFRRRMDLKRARMDQMSKAEKEEFLYRIRLHRPDAVEDFDNPNDNKTINKDNINTTSSESFSYSKKSAGATNQRKDEREYADLERKILRERFGLTDEEIDRIDHDNIMGKPSDGRDRKSWRGGGHERQGGFDLHQRDSDPIYAGLDSSR